MARVAAADFARSNFTSAGAKVSGRAWLITTPRAVPSVWLLLLPHGMIITAHRSSADYDVRYLRRVRVWQYLPGFAAAEAV
jgi:hypothetical protein